MRTFDQSTDDRSAERYCAELESALMALALAGTGGLPDERTRALLRTWLSGTYNATAFGRLTIGEGRGSLEWTPEGDGYRLTWRSPTGLACPLARLYPQSDDSWVALVVAGVRDDPAAAMLAAEWGVARLAA